MFEKIETAKQRIDLNKYLDTYLIYEFLIILSL